VDLLNELRAHRELPGLLEVRCGPNACQIRITASGVIPTSRAIDRVD
jgi:hypothetical protein